MRFIFEKRMLYSLNKHVHRTFKKRVNKLVNEGKRNKLASAVHTYVMYPNREFGRK